jgi:hypothetical protein
LKEFSLRAVILGGLFGLLFGAVSVYVGLRAGLTVSASIPIAVLSISILRVLGRASILENNIVQPTGNAGQSIAAGVIFTLPALIFLGFDLEYSRIFLLALIGGWLGVLFMIPLRRQLIVEEHGNLTYPEGTACADVLMAGEQGGGLATKQAYYDGVYEIGDDEALVVEFPVPQDCHYWQILVADDRFATVDWVNRQSSLTDVQARVDPDGWFRGVASRQDPGVQNWLDKADWPWGILQARFYRASDYPETIVTKVPVAEVLLHLPTGTPVLSAEQRAEQLRHRRTGAQLRRIW